jgi:thioesterase domain-containing protein
VTHDPRGSAGHFESEVQKVAREKNGGVVDTTLFWDITVALGKDLQAVDSAGRERHRETLELLSSHVDEDEARAVRIADELRVYQAEQAETCSAKHVELFGRAPRRAGDPPDAEWSGTSGKLYQPKFDAADESHRKLTREGIVSSFWVLVGLLILSGLVNGLIDLLFKR